MLAGKPAAGTWKLRVLNRSTFADVTIDAFELYLRTAPAFPLIDVRERTASGDAVANGAAAAQPPPAMETLPCLDARP